MLNPIVMTEQEAKDFLYWFENDYKDRRAVLAYYKSFSLSMEGDEELWKKANEAKKVLGLHQFQRSFEQLQERYPSMTREYYDKKRREENLN
jgi:hypothetical protein